ncbi:succinate-semialdehyde dehydrogenase [Komagataeibacter rhaeticus]|uniref:NAD-dependent succinate-semialdehyde dehydrogenase n=1 Tax=Komagataeibacter rhaeticus TaxID=215221 RepID=A0A181CCP2_9PROT|nr:NAD-dependent succinate-semialdehyde dehydrogenase [Komagataeibacter rhaeticus]ATU71828.1 succinate-semialdehyde dehydrogenase [Komagataeibacter xylinus]KDU95888.1 succinate-semialdehyde dehydrogenase [Komagataeibacter rhaeticus AF1]MBL7240094.1 NAD-dependent succinate-semialdehyde dehydrogenase [Komagataeibacter rhaeticus]PYD54747.1 succinate-semialdehyde dehydrogenase [Komagataeibacter rhaeticus]QIP36051.1 NAD-dependent succinate-semialdehyde dehydrogenase [Komagataeibacter rhaeticus]
MAYATTNPYTGEKLKTFPDATDQEIQTALTEAYDAFKAWRQTSFAERAKVMTAAAQILRRDIDKYARLITLEMGKIYAEAKAETILSAEIFEYYAAKAEELLAPEKLPVANAAEGDATLIHQPQGIVFAVEPWNFPYYQVARIIAPQLSAGNTVLLKHASNVPQCAAAFDTLMQEAGLPKGAFRNLYAARHHTEVILSDPRVCGVALTGSEGAGTIIAGIAAKALKKSTMELGGSDAFIVLDDADLEKTVKWAVFGRHWNAGQVCVSAKRIIVADAIYDKFVEMYKKGVAALKAGDPMDPATQLAPLSSQKAADDLLAQVEEAKKHGAHVEVIGGPVPEKGAFFRPMLMTNLHKDNAARLWEFFGPVTQLYRAKDDADAIRIANDSPYGLGGAVFTRDTKRGVKVAEQIYTGMVYVNHPTMVKADLPFGGVARSGYGRELIGLGIKEFVNHKLIDVVDIDAPF